jgi:hypothetical protein
MDFGGGARRRAQGVGVYLLVALGAWAYGCDSEHTPDTGAGGTDAGEAGAGGVGQGGTEDGGAGGAAGSSSASSGVGGVGGAGGGGGCSNACSISAECPAPGDVCTSMGHNACRVCLHACDGSMCSGANTCVFDADCNASPDARCVCAGDGCTICVLGLF